MKKYSLHVRKMYTGHLTASLLSVILLTFSCIADDTGSVTDKVAEDAGSADIVSRTELSNLKDPKRATAIIDLIQKAYYYKSRKFLDKLTESGHIIDGSPTDSPMRVTMDKAEILVLRMSHVIGRVHVMKFIDRDREKKNLAEGYDAHYITPSGHPWSIMRGDAQEKLIFHNNGMPKRYFKEINPSVDSFEDPFSVEITWDRSGELLTDECLTYGEALERMGVLDKETGEITPIFPRK